MCGCRFVFSVLICFFMLCSRFLKYLRLVIFMFCLWWNCLIIVFMWLFDSCYVYSVCSVWWCVCECVVILMFWFGGVIIVVCIG